MFLLGKQSFDKALGGKESFYKVISKDSYDRLKFHIFAWLGLNPDYAPGILNQLPTYMIFIMFLSNIALWKVLWKKYA